MPHWEQLAQSPFNKGMIRHGGVKSIRNYVKSQSIELKPEYSTHTQAYLDKTGDPDGSIPKSLLIWGTRNTFQNLGLPGWSTNHSPKLLRRPEEPWKSWTYQALCKIKNENRLSIESVSFRGSLESNEPDSIFRHNADSEDEKNIEWAVTGQPLLWDGEIPPLELLAACTYDLRHIWHLQWEEWQKNPNDYTVHSTLMDVFMNNLHKPINERAEALSKIAARYGVPISDAYLHSSVGIRSNGDIVLLLQHGSLTELGNSHKALGSQRAILLDNGGSVGIAYWPKRAWRKSGWSGVKNNPTYFGNGSYFRPKGHAALVVEIKEDIVERPFSNRPSGLIPWAGSLKKE
jgi:hypothetical protein